MVFCDWLSPWLCMRFSRFIHVVAGTSMAFLLGTESYSIARIDLTLFIFLSPDGHLGCSYRLATVHFAAINIFVQVFVWTPVLNFFGGVPIRSGIVGSYGNSMFNFLRSSQTVFHSSCSIIHSYQQCMRVPVSPPPCQHLSFSFL